MAKLANVLIPNLHISGGGLDINLLKQILAFLPADCGLTTTVHDYIRACINLRFESSAFLDVPQAGLIPDILVNFSWNSLGLKYVDSLDMTAALAAYSQQGNQPKGPQTSCSRAGCALGSPCFMCTANQNSTTAPLYVIPSTWAQSINSMYIPNYSKISIPPGAIGVDPGQTISPKSSCSHKWKSYTGLNEQFDFCETCNVKRA